MRSPVQAASAFAVTLAAAVVLSGCSLLAPATTTTHVAETTPTPTAEAQTVRVACDELEQKVEALTDDMTEASALLATDLTTGAAQITSVAASFEQSVGEIENPDVIALATEAVAKTNAFRDLINAAAADPASADLDLIAVAGQDVDNAFSAIGDLCG